MLNKLWYITFIFLFLLIFSSNYSVIASADYYTESFDNSINTDFWFTTRGNLFFNSNFSRVYAIFSTNPGINSFQYFRSNELSTLKPDYNSINLLIKFSSDNVTQGAGYILSDNTPLVTQTLNFNNFLFFVWPKPDGTFHLFTSLCPEDNLSCNIPSQIANGVYALPMDDRWHEITITRINSQYELKLDSDIIFRSSLSDRVISSIGVGNPENLSNGQVWPTLYIDHIGLDTLPEYFPYYSQHDDRWADIEYDNASRWVSAGNETISRWGCALTSAAMMMRHYGIKTVDGQEVDPKNLNEWLKSQDDGYIGFGSLNWVALTRFAQESYYNDQAQTKLEFTRTSFPKEISLPSVIGMPGHYVVAHGEDGDNWVVNDPDSFETNSIPKSTVFTSQNLFTPSETDLSYFLFARSNSIELQLTNQCGDELQLDTSPEYITDAQDNTSQSPSFLLSSLPKPPSDSYTVRATNNSGHKGWVSLYLYDKQGEVEMKDLIVAPQSTITYEFVQEGGQPLAGVLGYLQSLRATKGPANGIYQSLYARFCNLSQNMSSDSTLAKFIDKQSPKHIPTQVKLELYNYLDNLSF